MFARVWTRRAVLVALLVFAMPEMARAHGRLKSSAPAAGAHLGTVPRELRFQFSEVPELTFSAVKLIGSNGREIPLGPLGYAADSRRTVIAAIRIALPSGIYVVQWQLAGDDGHPIRGRFEFVVAPGAMGAASDSAVVGAPPSATPDSATGAMAMHHDAASMPEGKGFGSESLSYVALRWAQFMALLLVVGAVVFRQAVLRIAQRKTGPESLLLKAAGARAARVGHVAAAALGVTLVLRLLAQSYAMHGATQLWDVSLSTAMIRNTTWGKGWLLQLVGVIIAGLGFHRARRARGELGAPGGGVRNADLGWTLATLGAVLVAYSPAFSGHASAVPKLRTLAIAADGLHVLAASSWLGTLALVLIAGVPAAVRLAATDRGPSVAALVNAFSPVALASAALAVGSGVFAAWLHVGRIPNLWGTRYGITLLVKLTILGVVALTGFYNWRFVQPRLGTDDATRQLRRSASVEVMVAVIVLLVTAVLVATPTSMDMEM